MTRTVSTSGYELGLLAAGSLTIIPGAIVIYFVKLYCEGFALGRVIIIPTNKVCFWQHGTRFQNLEKKVFLTLNSLPGWRGLGKLLPFLYLLHYV